MITPGALAITILAIVSLAASIALLVIALRTRLPALAVLGALPIVVGLILLAFDVHPLPNGPLDHVLDVIVGIGAAAVGILGGSPLSQFVLGIAGGAGIAGEHGGIVIGEGKAEREVLRGGAAIGYLERAAIIGSIVLGHPEGIAVIVAIKGLGRFSELDAPVARERFIIGTLVSFLWAVACGAFIVLS